MTHDKIMVFRKARGWLDVLMLLCILVYGGIAWAAYPASSFTWVNMAVCVTIIGITYSGIRSRISKVIRSLQQEG